MVNRTAFCWSEANHVSLKKTVKVQILECTLKLMCGISLCGVVRVVGNGRILA